MKTLKEQKLIHIFIVKLPLLLLLLIIFMAANHSYGNQVANCNSKGYCITGSMKLTAVTVNCVNGKDQGNENVSCCGGGSSGVDTSINFGCKGKGDPITDIIFSIIRFLSDGVGLVIIASVIIGGIQYIGARGDPNSTSIAVRRLTSSAVALVIFIFAYAILDYVIPAGFFQQ